MTPEEFIEKYLELESKLDVQLTLIRTVEEERRRLSDEQMLLATAHLAELTPLRAGQTIEIACLDERGRRDWSAGGQRVCVHRVMQADVTDAGLIFITVWAGDAPADPEDMPLALDPQPGSSWRYPEASTAAPIAGGGKEDR